MQWRARCPVRIAIVSTVAERWSRAVRDVHGGGMIVGDDRFGLSEMLNLADPMGMAVISVEYRLVPETPPPGPVEDCYAGLVWVSDRAHDLDIDPERSVITSAVPVIDVFPAGLIARRA
ncbi:alpha/beta hydrolase [Lentzea sp. HUAS TT2]|uniref:alpha/beta hydrolase n=1 Tax=Lentzea sp. HUAS TT2 TaxID=3447454 RepID=UPI003F72E00A